MLHLNEIAPFLYIGAGRVRWNCYSRNKNTQRTGRRVSPRAEVIRWADQVSPRRYRLCPQTSIPLVQRIFNVFRRDHHCSAPCMLRLFIWLTLLYSHGLVRIPLMGYSRGADSKADRPLSETPSGIAFDPHGVLRQEHTSKFTNDMQAKCSECTQCPEVETTPIAPIAEDRHSSRLGHTAGQEPLRIFAYRYEVYLSIRQIEPCKFDDCYKYYPDARGGPTIRPSQLFAGGHTTAPAHFPDPADAHHLPTKKLIPNSQAV